MRKKAGRSAISKLLAIIMLLSLLIGIMPTVAAAEQPGDVMPMPLTWTAANAAADDNNDLNADSDVFADESDGYIPDNDDADIDNDNAAQSEINPALLEIVDAFATLERIDADPGDVILSLRLSAQALQTGQDLLVDTFFNQKVNSNTSRLTYTYSDDEFSYKGFEAADGVTVLDEDIEPGKVMLTVMVNDYETSYYGKLLLTAKKDTVSTFTVSLSNEIVVKTEDEQKMILIYTASVSSDYIVDDRIPGDFNGDGKVDLLDLSEMIDAFGIDSTYSDWASKYRYMDFNQNGEVDIYDIALLARHIFDPSIELPRLPLEQDPDTDLG